MLNTSMIIIVTENGQFENITTDTLFIYAAFYDSTNLIKITPNRRYFEKRIDIFPQI